MDSSGFNFDFDRGEVRQGELPICQFLKDPPLARDLFVSQVLKGVQIELESLLINSDHLGGFRKREIIIQNVRMQLVVARKLQMRAKDNGTVRR